MSASRIATAAAVQARLGESPIWSAGRERLLWVGNLAPRLNSFDPRTDRNRMLALTDMIDLVAETPFEDLVMAQGCDLARLTDSGTLECFASAPDSGAGFRLNEGKFDPQGRLWVGLMANDVAEGGGVLYRYDSEDRWHPATIVSRL